MTLLNETSAELLCLDMRKLSLLSCEQLPESPDSEPSRVYAMNIFMTALAETNDILLSELVVFLLVECREDLGEHELAAHVMALDDTIALTTLCA